MPAVLIESKKVAPSARKSIYKLANKLGVKGAFKRFDSLVGIERGANCNHIVAVFDNGSTLERIGLKVCDRMHSQGYEQCEAAIADIDYILGTGLAPRTVLTKFDDSFPDGISGATGVASRWERQAIHLEGFIPFTFKELSEATEYARQAGKIAFFVKAFRIGDRHGRNFVWNTEARRLIMIDNECAFEYGDNCAELWRPLKNFMRIATAYSDNGVGCLCKDCYARRDRAAPIPDNGKLNNTATIRNAIIEGFMEAVKAFSDNVEVVKKALSRYTFAPISKASSRCDVFVNPNALNDRFVREIERQF